MKTTLMLILLTLSAAVARAGVSEGPGHTILWNKVASVVIVDDYAVGLSADALSISRWDDSLAAFQVDRILPVAYEAVSMERDDSLLFVRTADQRLAVYDLGALPDLPLRWLLDPGIPFADFAFDGHNLYVSAWFDGLWRFELDASGGARFVDSSMAGVMVTDLEVSGDRLYALDEYNGIMRYDISDHGFGQFIDYLYVSQEIASFALDDTLVLMAARGGGMIIGRFDPVGSTILATLDGIDQPQQILIADSSYVLVTARTIEMLPRGGTTVAQSVTAPGYQPAGDLYTVNGRPQLLLPNDEGGMTLFDLADLTLTRSGAYRSGPIKDLKFADGVLLTAGGANPIDVFAFDSIAAPSLAYTMYPRLVNVQAMEPVGDSLLAYYAGINKLAFILRATDPDSFYLERSFHLQDTLANELIYLPDLNDTLRTIVTVGESSLQAYTIDDSGSISIMPPWRLHSRIATVGMRDSLLVVGTVKRQLWFYRINADFTLTHQAVLDLTGLPRVITWVGDRLLVFAEQTMFVYEVDDEFQPSLDRAVGLPLAVVDVALANGKLYGIGPEGIGLFAIDSPVPELIDLGGNGGRILAVAGNVLAASDGGSVEIYRLEEEEQPTPEPILPDRFEVAQNFPNPFNASTTIRYSLASASQVKIVIYNTLGRTVRTLLDMERPAGNYQVIWDGTDGAGHTVATGVYFYRFEAGDVTSTRKMLLLK